MGSPVSRCPRVEGGYRSIFELVSVRGIANGCIGRGLALVLNNGEIISLLEHMPAYFQSAADQFIANRLKADRNSLDGKELK